MNLSDEHHDMPEQKCLRCGHEFDSASAVGRDATPKEGDATLCIGCGHLMVFGADLMLRELTEDEHLEMGMDPRVRAAQDAIAHVNKKRAS